MNTTERLMQLQEAVFDLYGYDFIPKNNIWASMVLDIAKQIITEGLADRITPEDLDELTEENYHTARRAAEIAQSLQR